MNIDNESLTDTGRLILKIADTKGINENQLSKRIGYKTQSNLHDRLKNDLRLTILSKICDALGVELCIISGWKKYTLNNVRPNRDLDIFMNTMNEKNPSANTHDFWEEQNEIKEARVERRREQLRGYSVSNREKEGREAYNARMREYNAARREKAKLQELGDKCLTCRYTEPRLEKDGYKHYCTFYEDYKAVTECNDYEPKPIDIKF